MLRNVGYRTNYLEVKRENVMIGAKELAHEPRADLRSGRV